MFEFKLPDLGEGIHEGEILKWHVKAGDTVAEDQSLLDLETDKAAVTIPSPVGGVVERLGGAVGETVMVGSVIVVIQNGAGASSAEVPPAASAAAMPAAVTARPVATVADTGSEDIASVPQLTGPVPAAPATRRLARQLGVTIGQVAATGPGGRVTVEDVQRAASANAPAAPQAPIAARETDAGFAPAAAPANDRRAEVEYAAHAASAIPFLDLEPMPDFSQWGPVDKEPLRSIRRRVAHKMVTSKIIVPHVAHMDEADVTLLEEFRLRAREQHKGQPGGKLTLLSFVVKAVTAGLKATPAFNASLDPFREELIFKRYYHIGIAADTGRGLIVPVVRDTDRKSIMEISQTIEAKVHAAREGTLDVEDLRGGTFTITNVGPLGGTALIPAINYPEVAILGMGRVQEKPVVREGQIVIRKMLPLTLAFDHRVADGADAARFVSEMVQKLSDPNLLLLET